LHNKKVFILSPRYVFPPIEGTQKDIMGHILLFKKLGYQVYLFCYSKNSRRINLIEDSINYGIEQIIILDKGNEESIKNIYTRWYQVSPLINQKSIETIQVLIDSEKPEVLFFEYSRFAYLLTRLVVGESKVIFRPHNFELMHAIEKEALHLNYDVIKSIRRIKNAFPQWVSIYRNEKLMFKNAFAVLSISPGDVRSYKRWYWPKGNALYFPSLFPKTIVFHQVSNKNVLNVFYMGSNFTNNVNRSGANILIKKIIPAVNISFPNKFHFYIIGKDSLKYYSNIEVKNLTVLDFVDDLDTFLADMDISCISVKAGRGCKMKMLESLLRGIPTIGFKKTFAGIPYQRNCFLTANSVKQYLAGFRKLLSYEFRKRLSENSKRYISSISNEDKLIIDFKRLLGQ